MNSNTVLIFWLVSSTACSISPIKGGIQSNEIWKPLNEAGSEALEKIPSTDVVDLRGSKSEKTTEAEISSQELEEPEAKLAEEKSGSSQRIPGTSSNEFQIEKNQETFASISTNLSRLVKQCDHLKGQIFNFWGNSPIEAEKTLEDLQGVIQNLHEKFEYLNEIYIEDLENLGRESLETFKKFIFFTKGENENLSHTGWHATQSKIIFQAIDILYTHGTINPNDYKKFFKDENVIKNMGIFISRYSHWSDWWGNDQFKVPIATYSQVEEKLKWSFLENPVKALDKNEKGHVIFFALSEDMKKFESKATVSTIKEWSEFKELVLSERFISRLDGVKNEEELENDIKKFISFIQELPFKRNLAGEEKEKILQFSFCALSFISEFVDPNIFQRIQESRLSKLKIFGAQMEMVKYQLEIQALEEYSTHYLNFLVDQYPQISKQEIKNSYLGYLDHYVQLWSNLKELFEKERKKSKTIQNWARNQPKIHNYLVNKYIKESKQYNSLKQNFHITVIYHSVH